MDTAPPMIELDGLRKSFGHVRALRDVTLDVHAGEVVGFIGPNGAGKSTTIRVLADLIRADGGSVRLLGADPGRGGPALRAQVGFLPGDLALWPRMRVRETLELFGLALDRAVGDLSSGNRRKVGVVQAFMHEPRLYVLDEPTGGLDPFMQREFADALRERVDAGAGALVSSHSLDEVEHVADRIAVIRDGTVIERATVHELVSRMPLHVLARSSQPCDAAQLAAGLDGVSAEQRSPTDAFFRVTGALAPLLARLAELPLIDLDSGRPDLAEAFLAMYEDEPR